MPPAERTAGRSSAAAAARLGIALAALALAAASLGSYRGLEAARSRLLSRLEGGAARGLATVIRPRVEHENDPAQAELAAARVLVASELDPATRARLSLGDPARDREASARRLDRARRLSRDAWSRRPASWQAPMLLGAATYLAWSVERDPRLFTEATAWERPLATARSLAPAQDEPGRFLVTAYLELWPVLSEEKRELARGLLARSFADPPTLHRLIGAWLSVARSRQEAFAPIPATPEAWREVETALADRADWQGYVAARERWGEALTVQLAALADAGEAQLRDGDAAAARSSLLDVLARARPDRRDVAVVERSLALLPPSAPGGGRAAAIAAWTSWALDLCALERCPLTPRELDRLAILSGDLPRSEEALAAVLGGRLPAAELVERRSNDTWSDDWVPYWIAKARALLALGHPAEAGRALDRAVRTAWERPAFWLARRRVAEALHDRGAAAAADARLKSLRALAWEPYQWTFRGTVGRLEMLTAGPARGLALEISEASAQGVVAAVRFDGRELTERVVRPGDRLELAVEADAGLHLLELRSPLNGGLLLPGRVKLRP